MPGPRKTSLGALPMVPFAGRPKTPALKYSPTDLWPFGSVASPLTTTRAPSPPPVMFSPSVVVNVTPLGKPLANVAIPETCQLSRIDRETALFQTRLALGIFHNQLTTKTWV